MKKLFPLLLFIALSNFVSGQTSGLITVITAPCHNDGIITAGFSGVTPPLTVTWTTSGTSGTTIIHTGVSGLSDILTGYSGGPVSVSAIGSVDPVPATASFGGAPPFTYIDSPTSAMCPALGSDTVIVIGGTSPFTYYWYNKATMAFVGSGSSIHAPMGQYGVTITDAGGCTYGSTVNNDGLGIFTTAPFFDSMVSTVAACTNGTAAAFPVGAGVAPYTYLWSTGATTPAISGLIMGVYSVKITDANGCMDSNIVEVMQSITISAPVTPTAATCTASDGAVIAFGSGGTPPYSYVWSNGATTQSQTGLAGGNYNVNVTDANGCIGFGGSTVSNSTPIVATYTTTPSLCTSPTGTASLTLSGGTSPYVTTWITTPPQTGLTATTLTYGFYDFHVTDAVGCLQHGTVYVPPIDVISVSFTATAALCTLSNGSMTAYPTGGVAPYTYAWSTGATTAGISSKPAGTYGLTITDALGCVVNKSPYLPDNSPLATGIFTTPATCIFTADGIDSATAWGGTPPYHYNWSNGGATRTITGLPTGPYWLWVSDAAGCTTWNEYSYVGYDTAGTSCYCTISGTVFADYNNNCTQDPGEPGIPNIQIQISGRGYTYTDVAGNYAMKVPAGSYTVSETVLAFYPLAGCQPNNIPVTVGGGGCTITENFANSIDTIHDVHISTWDYLYNAPVVGHTYTQVSIVTNDGTVTEDSVLVGYKPDGQLFEPTFVPGGYFAGSPYSYSTSPSFVNLAPGAHQQFFMNFSVPTNIPLGTVVTFKDSVAHGGVMSNWLTDYSPWNNVNDVSTTVIGSFDPNFKEVHPKGTGSNGTISYSDSVLEYMVHFQNTGTYMAENITVIDTLDKHLDWKSLRPEFESGKCQVLLSQVNDSVSIAKFIFSNIDLPPAMSDEVRSNGMFTYTIHLKRRLPVGTHIRNNASIYFDYNAPVKTNTTLNTIGDPDPYTSVSNVTPVTSALSIYPNPAENSFSAIINAVAGGQATLSVTDVTGKVLSTSTIMLQKGNQSVRIDATKLAPGTYFVSCASNGSTETRKLVIIK